MRPSTTVTTLRPDLDASVVEFSTAQAQNGFIWDQVFKPHDVQEQSGTYGVIPLEYILQKVNVDRTSNGAYNRFNIKFEDATYKTRERGLEVVVGDRNKAIYRDYFDQELVAANASRFHVIKSLEEAAADALFNATTFASYTNAVTNEWDDTSNATPIDDLKTAKKTIRDRCGVLPDTLIINWAVFENLRRCDQIMDSIMSSGAGESSVQSRVTLDKLKEVFDIPNILVAGARVMKNTADEGQTASLSDIWSSEYAMLCKVATDSMMSVESEISIGRTWHYAGDGSTISGLMESYRSEEVRGDVIRCRLEASPSVIYPICGQLLSNITT